MKLSYVFIPWCHWVPPIFSNLNENSVGLPDAKHWTLLFVDRERPSSNPQHLWNRSMEYDEIFTHSLSRDAIMHVLFWVFFHPNDFWGFLMVSMTEEKGGITKWALLTVVSTFCPTKTIKNHICSSVLFLLPERTAIKMDHSYSVNGLRVQKM